MTRRNPVLLCLLWFVLPLSSATAQEGRFDLEKTKSVLSGLIEQTLANNGIPSMSIALVRGDSVVWTAAFGYANMYSRTPATTETLYSSGSTFKSATASALMQLAEQSKFRLNDPINRYLGDDQVQDQLQSERPVTFTTLLSHWSGLKAGAAIEPIWGRKLPKTLEAMTTSLYSIRAPETKYEYNNFAYGVAGLLVQKISGIEYEQYMLDHVLKPLGITTPHPVYPSPDMVERMALPYRPGGSHGKPEPEAQVHFDVYPAGDIYLTAGDMARFLGAHLNGGVFNGNRILSAESVAAMHTPRFDGTYGFGFWSMKDSTSGHTMIYHTGAIPGQRAFMMGDLDARVGVYYMTNSDFQPDAAPPSEIVDAALKLLRGEEYVPKAERQGIAVDEQILASYVGTYMVGAAAIVISRIGDALVMQQTGQSAINELLAQTPTQFFQRGSPLSFSFEGDGGRVDRLVIAAGGQQQIATRRK